MVQSDTWFAKKIDDGWSKIKYHQVSLSGIVDTIANFSFSPTINLRVLYYDVDFYLSVFASYVQKPKNVENVTSKKSTPPNYFVLFGSAFDFPNKCFGLIELARFHWSLLGISTICIWVGAQLSPDCINKKFDATWTQSNY